MNLHEQFNSQPAIFELGLPAFLTYRSFVSEEEYAKIKENTKKWGRFPMTDMGHYMTFSNEIGYTIMEYLELKKERPEYFDIFACGEDSPYMHLKAVFQCRPEVVAQMKEDLKSLFEQLHLTLDVASSFVSRTHQAPDLNLPRGCDI